MPRSRQKSNRLALICAALLSLSPMACSARDNAADWPLWNRFHEGFIQEDGRVVDWTDGARTVSEGQAYALFLALVANDRERFDRVLAWTHTHLAKGDLAQVLPAWKWGHDAASDRWGVLDANSATDADLFIVYSLLEAARLWRHSAYAETGHALLRLVKEETTVQVDQRSLLLPAPLGFDTPQGLRLNPSYIPPFQLHYLAQVDRDGPWAAILTEATRALHDTAPQGLVADWILLSDDGYRPDPVHGTVGSYDAIRVYLWAAMTVPGLAVVDESRNALRPSVEHLRRLGYMPERWDVASARHQGIGPPGFQLAMAPLLDVLGDPAMAIQLRARANAEKVGGLYGRPARYYDQALALFAEGYRERRYQFDQHGRLILKWHTDSANSR
jgi:endo-1,4-beta-D-glucanase Y